MSLPLSPRNWPMKSVSFQYTPMLAKTGMLFTTDSNEVERRLRQRTIIKHRLAKDADYFTHKLSSLEDINPPSNSVIDAVNDITLP